ncbi:hypothetical protein FO519_004282 [Halicephalobus sp. NKZ332]|nr:hypothetical protein FO519_004282 [Halicephalobus sp. NKZ332]
MAYASLANVPPVVGLYSSFFPTLLYAVFGTSKHIMYGMFAVPSLMVGSIIDDLNPQDPNCTLYEKDLQQAEAIEICAAITFCLGLIFMLMSLLRLHTLTDYLSDNLVAGFTTAASIHVLFSQLPKLFAIKVQRREGFFKLGLIAYDLLTEIRTTNLVDFSISVICIGILMIGRYLVNPRVTKKLKFPIPFELLIVIISTLISKFFYFERNFDVSVVSTIPTGVPTPQVPDFSRVPSLLPRAIPIAIVIFGTTISVGKLFAKKHGYKVYPAQDLRAMGFIQLIVSFFRCHPGSGSLSRSAVASQLGGKSQFVSMTCASVVLVVVLWLGPLLYHLPICVLASIIFVALQGMFAQFRSLGTLWKASKIDFTIWMVSFLATSLYDVSEGLLIAVGFSLFTEEYQEQKSTKMSKNTVL